MRVLVMKTVTRSFRPQKDFTDSRAVGTWVDFYDSRTDVTAHIGSDEVDVVES